MPESTPTSPDLNAMLAHSGWVRALARSLVADPDLADDIEQQTWLTAMRRPPSDDRNLRSWLGSVVRSMAGMHWRESEARRKREQVVAERREGEASSGVDAARPESLSERMDTFRELAAAVAELPEPYGTSVYLRYFEELSVREVARRTQVPEPTAQSRISRGVQMLRTRMEHRLGDVWRQRCLVFTLPLAKAPWWGAAAILTMTMKTKLLLGAALLALFSLFLLEPWATNPTGLGKQQQVVAADLGSTSGQKAAVMQPVADVSRTDLQPGGAAPSVAPAEAEQMLIFHVLDAVSLEPVSEAEVWYFDHATDPEEEWRHVMRREYLDSEQLVERFGEPQRLAADGTLHVPFPEGYAQVIARREGAFAYKFHHPDFYVEGEEPELLMKQVREQQVRVVGEDGQPMAGIEVQFCPEPAKDAAHARASVRTDASGRATFRHLELFLREDHPEWTNTIAVPIPGVEPAYMEWEGARFGSEVIEFVVPPTGEVHVTCINADGSFVPDGTAITMCALGDGGGFANTPYLRGNGRIGYTRNGVVEFQGIGVGSGVMLTARERGKNGTRGIGGDGPSQEGEIVKVELKLGPAAETFTMRVVDFQGRPPASDFYTLFAEAVSAEGEQGGLGHSLYLGEEGLLEFTLPEELDPEAHLLRLILHPQAKEPVSTSSFALVEFDLEKGAFSETREVAFGAETIVAGRLVDETGEPIHATRMILRIVDRRVEPGNLGAFVSYLHVRTDASGRFQFRGPAPTEFLDYTLHLPSPGFSESWGADPAVDFRFGQSDLVLTLNNATDLDGRILVNDPAILPMLQLRGFVPGENGSTRILDLPIEVPNGRIAMKGLALASTEFRLSDRATGRILQTRMIAESKASDFTWDLRNSLFLHRLRIQTPHKGERLDVILASPRTGSLTFSATAGENAPLLIAQEALQGSISVLGYARQSFVSHGEEEIFLGPGIPVTLHLADGVTFPEDLRWRLELRHLTIEEWGEELSSIPSLKAEFRSPSAWASGFNLHLPVEGVWVLAITPLSERYGMVSAHHGSLLPEPRAIEITASDSGQGFTLAISQDALDLLAEGVRNTK